MRFREAYNLHYQDRSNSTKVSPAIEHLQPTSPSRLLVRGAKQAAASCLTKELNRQLDIYAVIQITRWQYLHGRGRCSFIPSFLYVRTLLP